MHVVDIPMRVRFRRQDRRSALLIHGDAGWGEFSPFPEYDDRVAARWLAAAREAADVGWPEPRRSEIPVNTTVPAVPAQQAHDMVAASGCRTAKVKVAEPGQTLADDEARVEAVRDALGPDGRLRIDANAAWTIDEAETALRTLDRYDLEYAEQPVLTLEEMAALRRRVDVRLAADESIRTAADPMRVVGLEAADIVVLKVQPLGGVRACLRLAERCGLPVVVSSAIETSIGIAAGVALAAALPALPYACGLGTVPLLDGDVCRPGLTPVAGLLPVVTTSPEPDLLARWAADDELARWWQERAERAQAVLDRSADDHG
ncbi:MAG TPA: o-succinylbenzoate synthase [Mycobacteriales bacterium]|jgi:O-succinylbenzoate synthase|nr:o-succinylbenzoate synthase [Mycobacteriales bacterium]